MQALFLCLRSGNDTGKMRFYDGEVLKKRTPDGNRGALIKNH